MESVSRTVERNEREKEDEEEEKAVKHTSFFSSPLMSVCRSIFLPLCVLEKAVTHKKKEKEKKASNNSKSRKSHYCSWGLLFSFFTHMQEKEGKNPPSPFVLLFISLPANQPHFFRTYKRVTTCEAKEEQRRRRKGRKCCARIGKRSVQFINRGAQTPRTTMDFIENLLLLLPCCLLNKPLSFCYTTISTKSHFSTWEKLHHLRRRRRRSSRWEKKESHHSLFCWFTSKKGALSTIKKGIERLFFAYISIVVFLLLLRLFLAHINPILDGGGGRRRFRFVVHTPKKKRKSERFFFCLP